LCSSALESTFTRYFLLAAMTQLVLVPSAWAGKGPAGYLKKPDAWFADQEAKRIAANGKSVSVLQMN
jgi:hypothetical protein